MTRKRMAVVLAIPFSIYGCGGGGGDDPAPPPALSTISEASAPDSVGTVYQAGVALFDGSATSAVFAAGAQVKASAQPGTGAVPFAIARFEALLGKRPDAAQTSTTGLSTKQPVDEQEPCENAGGTMRLQGDVADPDGFLSTGDHATLTFTNCMLGGITIDGALGMSDVAVSAQTSAALFTFDALRFSSGTDNSLIDGSFRLTLPTDADASQTIPITLEDVSLSATTNGRTATLSNVTSTTRIDFGTGAFSYSLSGRIADSGRGISVNVGTEVPFAGIGQDLHEGSVWIEGANATRARAVVSSPNYVTISVDANGDGTYETTLDPRHVSTL